MADSLEMPHAEERQQASASGEVDFVDLTLASQGDQAPDFSRMRPETALHENHALGSLQ